jgi:hypothetical protein
LHVIAAAVEIDQDLPDQAFLVFGIDRENNWLFGVAGFFMLLLVKKKASRKSGRLVYDCLVRDDHNTPGEIGIIIRTATIITLSRFRTGCEVVRSYK